MYTINISVVGKEVERNISRLLGVVFALTTLVIGCNSKLNNLPLPTSAKEIADSQIAIPFPYKDKFPSRDEEWVLDRDSSNQMVLKVLFRGKEVALLPIDGIGNAQETGQILLGDKEYFVKTITLNSDKSSGWVTIIKQ